jgi:hypothetical protein
MNTNAAKPSGHLVGSRYRQNATKLILTALSVPMPSNSHGISPRQHTKHPMQNKVRRRSTDWWLSFPRRTGERATGGAPSRRARSSCHFLSRAIGWPINAACWRKPPQTAKRTGSIHQQFPLRCYRQGRLYSLRPVEAEQGDQRNHQQPQDTITASSTDRWRWKPTITPHLHPPR